VKKEIEARRQSCFTGQRQVHFMDQLLGLAHLDPPRLQLALDRGEISPIIGRKAAQKLVKSYRTKQNN
jgi:hypothetical protein